MLLKLGYFVQFSPGYTTYSNHLLHIDLIGRQTDVCLPERTCLITRWHAHQSILPKKVRATQVTITVTVTVTITVQ